MLKIKALASHLFILLVFIFLARPAFAAEFPASIPYGETAVFEVEVGRDGDYEILVKYKNMQGQLLPTEAEMRIDGLETVPELKRLKFESVWLSSGEANTDRYGNEMPKPSIQDGKIAEKRLDDSSHRISEPLLISLSAGRHELSLKSVDGTIEIYGIEVVERQEQNFTQGDASGAELYVIEGEDLLSANEPSVHASGEYSPELHPYSAGARVLNFLDDSSFSKAGTRVDYEVDVGEGGWHNISLVCRQAAKTDFPVFVDVLIDGEKKAQSRIGYSKDFQIQALKLENGNTGSFYLEPGLRKISFVISSEPLKPIYDGAQKAMREMSSLATEITRLTGGVSQDKYRDYRLEDYIPGLAETLERWAGECRDMAEYAKKYSGGKRSSVFSALELCEDMLLKLAEEPEDLPRRLGELSEGASSVTRHLAQMVQDMDNNAVGIDRILVHQQDAELPEQKNFFEKLWDGIVRFFLSFSRKEYSVASESKGSLRIWMARPRPYVELLQSMIDSEFTAKTGIRADLSVMPDQGKLALAAASGDAPDVALSVGYVLPSYLNIRGALLDLKQFEDFTEVAQRFPEGLFIPSIYEGGVYAIPETMNFWVMFCRTDIFEQLGIPVPNSMEEVKMLLPELQRRSMNFYFPTAGMIGQKLFPATMPLIVQSGGGFFGSEIGATTLDSEKSLAGFKELTDLFTVYDLPVEVPAPGFYQEFRSGTLPIGIADVSTYNLLLNSAPEIKGLWSVSLFPGLTDESGNIQRYTTGGAESDMIFAQTQMEEEAWEFLKWWSSSEVQARFGMSLQSLHGGTYMWNTANREAFSQLPIPSEHKAVILEQTDWMVEVPWVPGTYMVERELSNAYNSVVVDGIAVRRAMDTAVKRIDREVFRKLEEFGYSNGGRFETPSVSALGQGG